jgi:histidyl-tRNA synthetase
MGDVVLGLILEKYDVLPLLRPNPSQVLVATFDPDLLPAALSLSSDLRDAGLRVEWYPEASRLQKQYKYADGQAIPVVALIGPEEAAEMKVSVKDMRSGDERKVERENVKSYIKKVLEQAP